MARCRWQREAACPCDAASTKRLECDGLHEEVEPGDPVRFEGDAGSVSIVGTAYHLRQLHWHAPTEHSVNGCRYDMELHMVHQSAQGKGRRHRRPLRDRCP
ncbi:hypothetical protein VPH35_125880 [Triticum aestivum]